MNKIDILKYSEFPMSSETLTFMQDIVTLVAKLSSIGGSTYILDGCEVAGDRVSAGTLVIDGEILPYAGGLTSSNISIQESKDSVQVYDKIYDELYINRRAVASTASGSIAWSRFQRLPSLTAMAQSLYNIDNALTSHINNHTVAWDKVSGRPSAFPPTGHNHDWGSISGKPNSYPPSAHTHPGVLCIGSFPAAGGPATMLGSSSIAVVASNIRWGYYLLTHNIGHTNYLVLGGSGINNTVSIRGMYDIAAATCMIVCSEDGGPANTDVRFTIITT